MANNEILESLNELDEKIFKAPNPNPLVLSTALNQLIGVTGTDDGCKLLAESKLLKTLLSLLFHSNKDNDKKIICNILVNLSAVDTASSIMLSPENNAVETLLKALNSGSQQSSDIAKILSNLTHSVVNINSVVASLQNLDETLKSLREAFLKVAGRSDDNNMDYIAMVFCNLSAHADVRRWLTNSGSVISSLLPFISFADSTIIRAGIVGLFKNLSFDIETHEYLLKELDLLPNILLPLAGNETISDEETEKLPVELQYLEDTKQREPVAAIRKDLLETLNKLCTTQSSREFLRDANAYVILREYHKWEQNRELLLACENVVDILIRTEEEIGRENLEDGLEVPDDLVDKFNKMDRDFIEPS